MIHMVAIGQWLMCCKRQFYVQNVYEQVEVIEYCMTQTVYFMVRIYVMRFCVVLLLGFISLVMTRSFPLWNVKL
jgi:hypothetical protein